MCIEDEWESILLQGRESLEDERESILSQGRESLEDEWESILLQGRESLEEMMKLKAADSFREGYSSQTASNGGSYFDAFWLQPADKDSVVRIVFTSGTTSFPKAVMLTLTNIFSGWKSLARRVFVGPEDVCYLFLPLNHTYGGIFNFIYSLVFGFRVYLTTAIHDMAREMMQIKPTIFCAVPIVLTRLQAGAAQAGVSVSALMGGRMRYLFCGGAPLAPELRQAYLDAGIEVLNAYALSETSSSLSIDYPGDTMDGSAGRIFEDIEVKVVNPDANVRGRMGDSDADDYGVMADSDVDDCSVIDDSDTDVYGEIAVRGDNVFAGYYGDEAATAAVMTSDGFFLTGDIGCIRDNHVFIKGRKDSRLVFANGEKVSAAAVAKRVQGLDESIKSVKVYIRDNTLTCDIYVASESGEKTSAGSEKEISERLQNLIDAMNQQVSKYERVGKYNIYNADRLLK